MTYQPLPATPDASPQLLTEDQIAESVHATLSEALSLYLSGRISDGEYWASVTGLRAWATLERTYILVRTR